MVGLSLHAQPLAQALVHHDALGALLTMISALAASCILHHAFTERHVLLTYCAWLALLLLPAAVETMHTDHVTHTTHTMEVVVGFLSRLAGQWSRALMAAAKCLLGPRAS